MTAPSGIVCGVKDQYVGDVNDYLKYALLRALTRAHGGTLQVCWMRTAPDGRTDGGRLGYLNGRDGLRTLDPLVFDELARIVRSGRRSVRAVQDARMLGGARFHSALLGDEPAARRRHFERIFAGLGPQDLVFFDPDNGLEVASVRPGRRNSCKYVFWDELEQALGEERSVCLYQHFPRVQRKAFIATCMARLRERFPGHRSFALSSPWVAHLVCADPCAVTALHSAGVRVAMRSAGRLTVTRLDSAEEPRSA
jgi:hypothetical protein